MGNLCSGDIELKETPYVHKEVDGNGRQQTTAALDASKDSNVDGQDIHQKLLSTPQVAKAFRDDENRVKNFLSIGDEEKIHIQNEQVLVKENGRQKTSLSPNGSTDEEKQTQNKQEQVEENGRKQTSLSPDASTDEEKQTQNEQEQVRENDRKQTSLSPDTSTDEEKQTQNEQEQVRENDRKQTSLSPDTSTDEEKQTQNEQEQVRENGRKQTSPDTSTDEEKQTQNEQEQVEVNGMKQTSLSPDIPTGSYGHNQDSDEKQSLTSRLPKEVTEGFQEVPYYHRSLSVRLNMVLDNIGATERFRRIWQNAACTCEVLHAIVSRYIHIDTKTTYQFGSSAEGTTRGLWSDVDSLICPDVIEVVQEISSAAFVAKDLCFLMVRDDDTKLGYTKLQRLENGVPQTIFNSSNIYRTDKVDRKGRLVVCREHAGLAHGPADMFIADRRYPDQDIVYGYRCRTWPNCASSWLSRPRHFGWPAADLISQMETLGFFVVPIGHRYSLERDKEWRLSLSLQERMLMYSLTDTQFKCYILLKMIKKDIIFPLMRRESVSSYQLKTCLFYVIEETPETFWTPDNLLMCVQECLKRLLQWTAAGYCPNYFIPEENMFEGRLDNTLRSDLLIVVQKLLSSEFCFLMQIKCDYLGRHLRGESLSQPRFLGPSSSRGSMTCNAYVSEIEMAAFVSYNLLRKCASDNYYSCIISLLRTMSELRRIKTIAEHTRSETTRVTSLLMPYLELSLLSNICVYQFMKRNTETTVLDKPFNFKWTELSLELDRFSAKLKQAVFLYAFGYYRSSLDILGSLGFPGEFSGVSFCICQNSHTGLTGYIVDAVEAGKMSLSEFQSSFLASCVSFLPSEARLIPVVLAFEMIRSVHMPPGSRDEKHDFWYDWAAVDSKFLLHLLQYLNHQRLSMRKHQLTDISKMNKVLVEEKNLGHRDTALNVLGWIYEQEGRMDKAFACYRTSLQIKRNHNAAFWHLCIAVSKIINKKCAYKS